MNRYPFSLLLLLILLAAAILPGAGAAAPEADVATQGAIDNELLAQLREGAGGDLRLSYHRDTGAVRFLGSSPQKPLTLSPPVQAPEAASPETTARAFLSTYGKLFGLADAERDLRLKKQQTLEDGRSFVRFQQTYDGIPIIGGELIVQTGPRQQVISANGELLPGLQLDPTPAIDIETAREVALGKVAKEYGLPSSDLTATEPELWIYDPAIMGGPGPQFSRLVWRVEVTPVELLPIREFVLIDAQLGAIALHFNQVHTAKDRETYTAGNATTLPGTLVCDESDPTCAAGDAHAKAAHEYAGDTYDFYTDHHGRDGIDDAGMTIISTVRYGLNYANAFWNGEQMVYGDAYGFPLADDVVAHELTHGVTDHSSELFYFYQSGAINESFSDVWGEFVDLTNGAGSDAPGDRWAIGEDVSGLGAIRNMEDPTLFNHPDRVGSALYYCAQSDLYSGAGDNGGVHINSGVNNKAVFLMTDGGNFNGYTVTGLGIEKVAELYYEVQTGMLTSAADYVDLYDALIQASVNLGFSNAEQEAVKDALDAVEMNQDPADCPAPEAPVCETGTPSDIFYDDLESGGGEWQDGSNLGTSYWFAPHSEQNIGLPGPYATSGVDNIWGFAQGWNFGETSDTYLMMQNNVTLPANAYLHFNHAFGFESDDSGATFWDGGVLEYSVNGGSWQDAGTLFTHNGYNGAVSDVAGNPLGGREAFGADSRGYISSRLDLNSLAGEDVRFRFRIGTDLLFYDYGWFIDDVRIYTCENGANTPPTFAPLPNQTLTEGASLNNAIDLWAFASDAEDAAADLLFTISNTPDPGAGVAIDGNRYVDINPEAGWTGTTQVIVQVEDTGGLTANSSFEVSVTEQKEMATLYLPTVRSGP
ncbi:MAG TPA: M4 family metallopeptidase [Candidatus Sulfomarinibacteraceae bacterium]|nr:M4 family metallopeptidase [Candidatus Sulfomarinibacteraceae bacterium]